MPTAARIASLSIALAMLTFVLTANLARAAEKEPEWGALEEAAQALKPSVDDSYEGHVGKGGQIAGALATLTGEAVNPLLGLTIRSMWVYLITDSAERVNLAWYYQPKLWLPLLIIMLLMIFNSTIVEAFPPAKVPLNALGDMINKSGAVVSLPIIIAMFASSINEPLRETMQTAYQNIFPTALAAEGANTSSAIAAGETLWSIIGYGASIIVGSFIYMIVWFAFNTIDVLILLCPFPMIDATLKSGRLAVMALLTITAKLSPTLAIILAVPLFMFCLLIAGWSMRLSVFGLIYSSDILLLRRLWPRRLDKGLRAFSNRALKNSLPMRTCGRLLRRDDGKLEFSYRPWLVLPRRSIILPDNSSAYAVGEGMLNPYIVTYRHLDDFDVHFRLAPRYQTHEEVLNQLLALGGVHDTSAFRGFRALWQQISGTELKTVS